MKKTFLREEKFLLLISIYLSCFCNEGSLCTAIRVWLWCCTAVCMGKSWLVSFYREGKIDIAAVVNPHYKCMELLLSTHSAFPSLHIFPLDWRRRGGKGNYGGKGEWGGCFLRRVAVFVSWHKWRALFWKGKEKYKKKKDGQRKESHLVFSSLLLAEMEWGGLSGTWGFFPSSFLWAKRTPQSPLSCSLFLPQYFRHPIRLLPHKKR